MKRNSKKGFTIVELVIVIAVIAILAAVLIPTFTGLIQKAKDSAYLQDRTNKQTEGTIEKIDNPNYMTWEDFEKKFKNILDDAGSAPSGDAIKESVAEALEEAGFNETNLNEDIIKQIVDKELEKSDKSLTDEEIQAIADAVIEQINQNATEESSTNSSTTESSAEESSQVPEESLPICSTPESSVEESSEIFEESSEVSEESSEVSEESSEEDPLLAIFYAGVEEMDPEDDIFKTITFGDEQGPAPYSLDIACAFFVYPPELRDPDAEGRQEYADSKGSYQNWEADFEIEVSDDLPVNSIYFEGHHVLGTLGFTNPQTIPKDTHIKLLTAMQNMNSAPEDYTDNSNVTYGDLLSWCNEFDCGLANISPENSGKTITVSLCVYNDGIRLEVCSISFTFD
ncbi:MAG: type II secretion system protein [Clostridia bacterium]|nr:type II secretion system protein [Clostridia bacterium]